MAEESITCSRIWLDAQCLKFSLLLYKQLFVIACFVAAQVFLWVYSEGKKTPELTWNNSPFFWVIFSTRSSVSHIFFHYFLMYFLHVITGVSQRYYFDNFLCFVWLNHHPCNNINLFFTLCSCAFSLFTLDAMCMRFLHRSHSYLWNFLT